MFRKHFKNHTFFSARANMEKIQNIYQIKNHTKNVWFVIYFTTEFNFIIVQLVDLKGFNSVFKVERDSAEADCPVMGGRRDMVRTHILSIYKAFTILKAC